MKHAPTGVEYGTEPATLVLIYATPVERDVAFRKFRDAIDFEYEVRELIDPMVASGTLINMTK